MKKSKKLLTLLLGATMLVASLFGGCSGAAGQPEATLEGAPDYSQCTEDFRRWAFSMGYDDWIMLNGEKLYFEDGFFQTKDKTEKFVDIGYNMVFVDWAFSDVGFRMGFEGSRYEKVIRDCEELGLDTLWYGREFHSLSKREHSLIDASKWYAIEEEVQKDFVDLLYAEYRTTYYEETKLLLKLNYPEMTDEEIEAQAKESLDRKVEKDKVERLEQYIFETYNTDKIYFKSQEQLNKFCQYLLRDMKNYPSFAGVSLMDEPNYKMFQAMRETVIGLQSYDPDIYLMINLLPMSTNANIHVSYCEKGKDLGMIEAYKGYLNNYKKYLADVVDFIMYDDYPVCHGNMLPTYLLCHQMVSNFAKENNLKRRIVMQTYDVGNRRVPEYADMLWQANVSMAFGCSDLSNYMYLPSANHIGAGLVDDNDYVVKRDGTPNPLYYDVKDMNKEIAYNAKYLGNFKYQGMKYYRTDMTAPTGWGYTVGLENNEFSKLTSAEFYMLKDMGGMLLVTEMYDEANDQWGYYVVNGTDPGVSSEMRVTLTFDGYKNVQVVQSMETQNVGLNQGKITLDLGSGRGAFVMPY